MILPRSLHRCLARRSRSPWRPIRSTIRPADEPVVAVVSGKGRGHAPLVRSATDCIVHAVAADPRFKARCGARRPDRRPRCRRASRRSAP